jgi:serine/threonine protein phosphatase PrpC
MDLIMLEEKGIRELNELRSKISGQTNYNDAEPISDATGCTANVIVIDDKNYYIANCGDSRSVLCRDGTAVALSFDHKP